VNLFNDLLNFIIIPMLKYYLLAHGVTLFYSLSITDFLLLVWRVVMIDVKLNTKQNIIDTSVKVFLEKGLFKTSMDDIAKEAGLTRRTLYRYFDTKEDLAFEASIILLSDWNSYHNTIFTNLKGDGMARFDYFLKKLMDYMESRINVMKFIGEFDFYFQDDVDKGPCSDSLERFGNIILESDVLLTNLILTGIEDGSIRKDIDVKLIVATISNVLWSFGQRIAIRGHIIERETGINAKELFAKQIELYRLALKGS
jgi:AcrR family transcriptional regulator